jgi:methylphosphotriester-DNA--protein-cysteine methyltransferase
VYWSSFFARKYTENKIQNSFFFVAIPTKIYCRVSSSSSSSIVVHEWL